MKSESIFNQTNLLILTCAIIVMIAIVSCDSTPTISLSPSEADGNNESIIEQRDIVYLVEYEYRINDSVVQAFTISESDSTNIYLYEIGLISSLPGYTKTIVHRFTTLSNYYDYAETKNVPAEAYDIITDSLAYLAELYNLDSIVAADEEVPEWWEELEASLYDNIIPRGAISQLNDDWRAVCKNQHSDESTQIFSFPVIGMPVLGLLGWRNRVSSFTPLLLGGVDKVFQRSFYRRRLATFWNWGFTTTDFCGPLARINNNSNSWWSAGI